MALFGLDELQDAIGLVRPLVAPTPAYRWPLLARRTGVDVVVKHENHTPTGAFKVRGGLVYLDALCRSGQKPAGLVTATRGNHGQSIALAASRHDIPSLIVVPEGNSQEKNSAMKAFGAELVIAGRDFDESRIVAERLRDERGYSMVPSFHRQLVLGVASYAHELFSLFSSLSVVYVPIGMGSGISALITVRDLLGLSTDIVGVVSHKADAYARSFETGRVVSTESANTFADGMACREPHPEALEIVQKGAARIVRVSDEEIAEAVRVLYRDTHNLAEGAGAAALAALMQEQDSLAGRSAGVILSGANIDMPLLSRILCGETPVVGLGETDSAA